MCLCLEVVFDTIKSLCCFECCKKESDENKKKESKERKKRKLKTIESSKGRIPSEHPIGQTKPLSEIDENELLNKYWIKLPKDNCNEANEWLKTRGYEITNKSLGVGGFGRVFKATKYENDGKQLEVAAKVLETDLDPESRQCKKAMTALKNELHIMEALIKQIDKVKHNHIIKVFDRFIIEKEENDLNQKEIKAYIFMELAEGDLANEVEKKGQFTHSVAKRYFAQIVYAIDYMHRLNIAHRDLKLENFLLFKSATVPNQKDIKVSDFGLSRVQYKDDTGYIHTKTTGGTKLYKAPEILSNQIKITDKTYDVFKADIWALGVCLYKMLTKKFPFGSNEITTEKLIELQAKKISFDNSLFAEKKIESSAKDLILRLLEFDPDKRPKIFVVKSHKWLEGETSITLTQNYG